MKSNKSVSFIDTSNVTTIEELVSQIDSSPDGCVCLYNPGFLNPTQEEAILARLEHADIVHSGLSFHKGIPFSNLQLCTYNWNFLNPPSSFAVVSWKPSLEFMAFEKALYLRLGGFDAGYQKIQNAAIDFAYRALIAGGLPVHDPEFAQRAQPQTSGNDVRDESRFILKHLNRNALSFYRFCMFFMSGRIIPASSPVTPHRSLPTGSYPFKLFSGTGKESITSYSAIIPTINRYDYIEKSIQSLIRLSFPPAEIIVIDQSPAPRPALYQPFVDSGIVKTIYLKRAGQSTARNTGLRAASHPWVLLFEDDAEAWPEMVNEHVNLMKATVADVSTGIVVAPGQDETNVPEEFRKFTVTDILTTGNAFLSRETALSAGGFDPAFDHGPGADDDFGKRLYLAGKKIVYNFKSIEIHYKAPRGGMREHGAWWRNKTTFWGPFPPATQLYTIMQYYPARFRFFLVIALILKARKRYSTAGYLALLLLMPVKLLRSHRAARMLKTTSEMNPSSHPWLEK